MRHQLNHFTAECIETVFGRYADCSLCDRPPVLFSPMGGVVMPEWCQCGNEMKDMGQGFFYSIDGDEIAGPYLTEALALTAAREEGK